MIRTALLALGLLIFTTSDTSARRTDNLHACWKKQVEQSGGTYLAVTYHEQFNELYHSPEPWQQLHYAGSGTFWYSTDVFLKQDTLIDDKRTLHSKTRLDKAKLLFIDYGDKRQSPVTTSLFLNKIMETARYTPAILINYFVNQKAVPDKESSREFSVYKARINNIITRLYVRNADKRLAKITTLENDDLRGDVLSTFTYSNYAVAGGVEYPKTVLIEKTNGKVKDEIRVVSAKIVTEAPTLLEQPANYKINEDVAISQRLTVENYGNNIHFINVLPTGTRVMVAEFKDFLLVAEAPVNSKNGELIIAEAHKIAPGKPVRYFTFGHHHPDYIGGMRAFIHKGTTVLSVKEDKDYVSYLATAPHTLLPDSLQLQPRPLKWEAIVESTTITDGSYKLNIYHIGKKSGHTTDYLIYYFPQEKLLFEGDLVWIEKDEAISKAGENQAGLYHAIEDLRLDVKTIIQSWGIAYDGYKTTIPFEDLVQSVSPK